MKQLVHMLAASAAALALAGCGASTPQGAQGGAVAPSGPKVDRLVFALEVPTRESNELRMLQSQTVWQLGPMYEYLIGLAPDTGKQGPQLATDWKLEPDGLSFRFQLRKGVPFHNGHGEFGANDVITTWKEVIKEDSLQGSTPLFRSAIRDIEKVSDSEVIFRLPAPTAELLPSMTQERSGFEIMSDANLKASGAPTMGGTPLAGTGPYQFVERKQGTSVRFQRAGGAHWRAKPEFPEMEFRFMKEPSTRLAALLTSEAHLADLPADLQAEALKKPEFKVFTGKAPSNRVFVQFHGVYYKDVNDPNSGFMYPESPMSDVRVRRALSKAVNRDELNKAFFGSKGRPMFLNNYSPALLGWNTDWEKRFAEEYGYDPAKARQLLTEAGFGPSNPLTTVMMVLPVDGIPNGADVAEAVTTYWGAVGIKAELQTLDAGQVPTMTRAARFNNHTRIRATSSNQWTGTSTYFSGTKPTRSGGIGIPAGDEALNQAVGTMDEKRQAEYLLKAGNAWYEGHMDVPLFLLPPTIVANGTIVGDYVFPGNVSGNWSHLETITAVR